ncbi:MAG: glycosyl hydrolase [Bacteroidota bacterium]
MNSPSEKLPNAFRVLQMIHHFERWGTTDEIIRNKVRSLQKAGLGGLVANVNRENYLRDQTSWDVFQRGVKIAHEEGLRVWIYDEQGYPSATAGGLVLEKKPSLEAQGLIRVVDAAGKTRYEVVTLYEATHATENFYKKLRYPNILDPVTAATFLEVTHDRYARALEPIDQYVEAFFTDEPSLISVYIPTGREYPRTLPWHPRVPEEFRARKGYDLLPHRESLFVDVGEMDRKIRCDFYEVIAELCAETYFGGLQEWCQNHNVASSGHLLGEETMVWQTGFNGDPFTCYRKFDSPGIDMIISNPEKIMAKDYFMVPKVAGSASRLQGVRQVMCEISDFFGRRDKDPATIDQMKCTTGLLFSFGVTQLCSYYGLLLEPVDEVKPGQFFMEEYQKYTEFAARVSSMFTTGKIKPRVAVLYPILSLWAHFTPSNRSMYEPHPNPDVRYLDGAFTDLCRSLLQEQIDYDIVDERSLTDASIEGKELVVGEQRYQVLVLPPADTVRLRTMETILRFVEAGGSVLAHSLVPEHAADGPQADVRINEIVKRIRAAGALGGSEPGSSPIGYLIKSRIPPDCDLAPSSPNILCTLIQREEGPAYFFVNVSSKSYTGTCTFRAAGEPLLFNPSTGEDHPLHRKEVDGSLSRTSLTLRPFESIFVLFR